jgi:hypothetical protein
MSPLSFHSGCDGKNYSNPCGAWSMGVSVSSMGECGVIPEEVGVVFAETTSTSVSVSGGSYCTYGPNTTCYESGWPSCCAEEATCPEEEPSCEIEDVPLLGSSYCTYSPDMNCYESGWPSCCADEATCPEEKPACEIPLVGSSYCTYGPNTTCYESGWPSCCGSDNATCPEEQPPCEVTDFDEILDSVEGTAGSAASVLSTFSFVTAVIAVTVCATLFII